MPQPQRLTGNGVFCCLKNDFLTKGSGEPSWRKFVHKGKTGLEEESVNGFDTELHAGQRCGKKNKAQMQYEMVDASNELEMPASSPM